MSEMKMSFSRLHNCYMTSRYRLQTMESGCGNMSTDSGPQVHIL